MYVSSHSLAACFFSSSISEFPTKVSRRRATNLTILCGHVRPAVLPSYTIIYYNLIIY